MGHWQWPVAQLPIAQLPIETTTRAGNILVINNTEMIGVS